MNTRHLIAGLLAAAALPVSSADAIVNGRNAAEGDFPFMAQISNAKQGTSCSGSLLNANYVLTAAHCVDEALAGHVTVRVGNVTSGSGGVRRTVTRVIRHPQYRMNINTPGTDVALLRLAQPITSIKPLPLAPAHTNNLWDGTNAPWASYDDALVSGWGGIDTKWPRTPASVLQWTGGMIKPSTKDPATDVKMIRVNGPLCEGDSGSPLIVRVNGSYANVGVMTNVGCNVFGIYAEVAAGSNRSFVDSNVAKLPYTYFGVGDWDGDKQQDLIARHEATGNVVLFSGQSRRTTSSIAPVTIGTGYQGYTPFGVADWDGDRKQDLIDRHDASGTVYLQTGTNSRGYSGGGVFPIFTSMQDYTPFGIADWNGDTYQDLIARDDRSGSLYLFPGKNAHSDVGGGFRIALDFGGYTPFGIADWNGDGHQDLIARNDNIGGGPLSLFPGQPSTDAVGAAMRLGNGWEAYSPYGVTDWDRDGHQDLLTRNDASQYLYLVPGISYAGPSNSPLISIGYGY